MRHWIAVPALLLLGCSSAKLRPLQSIGTIPITFPAEELVVEYTASNAMNFRGDPVKQAALGNRKRIDCGPPVPQDLAEYERDVVPEIRRYSPEMLQWMGIKEIRLCTGIKFNGQVRNGVNDLTHGISYFEVSRGRHDRVYLKQVIHHEFFHLIDPLMIRDMYVDPE